MKTRVVVTDMGVTTSIGDGAGSFWQGLKDKTVGIAPITYFDTTDYEYKLVVEVKGSSTKDYMNAKVAHRMKAFSQLVVAASKEVLEHSGVDMEKGDPYRVSVCVGFGIESLQAMEKDAQRPLEKGSSRVNPLLMSLVISNMAVGNAAIQFGLKGKCFNVATACATGTHSIGETFRPTQYGEADVMVADGTEASITPTGIAGFTSPTALNTMDDPRCASIPSDEDRNGFVMGKGAGVVALGSSDRAKVWGANILAEVVGYGVTCDAYYITSPAEDGSGVARVTENAIRDAGTQPEDIDYVNAYGTSIHHNDLLETKATKLALGGYAGEVRINSIKFMVGHPLDATGGVELITCVRSIEDGYVHVTIGLEKPGRGCDPDYTAGDGVAMGADAAISNFLGFGERSASLIVRKFSE